MPQYYEPCGSDDNRGDIGKCLHRAFTPAQDAQFDDLLVRLGATERSEVDLARSTPSKRRWTIFP